MTEIVVGVVLLIVAVVVALRVLGLRSNDDEDELAGLITANWDAVNARIGDAEDGDGGES